MRTFRTFSIAVLCGAALFCASSASAHISLLEPAARYDGSVQGQSKACPCGVGESNRYCDVDGDRSDPDRSDRVTVLEAGSTVMFRWDEYVGHAGRYRVAFDPDGADLDDFNDNILMDFVDPAGNDGNSGNGSIWEMEVTVPDMPCDNCTLQLIQMMDGNTTDPVPDPVGRSSYYQCADIEIVAAGSDLGGPGPMDSGSEPPTDMGTTMPQPDLGTGPDPNDTGSTVQPGTDTGVTGGEDGGLSNVEGTGTCSTAGGAAGAPLLLLFVFVFLRRRRRR